MENWEKAYEFFKQKDDLTELDKRFIAVTEKMLSFNIPYCTNLVYSELWMKEFVQSTMLVNYLRRIINN